MYRVAKGHSVTLSKQEFRSGRPLPNGRDYSALIRLGIVEEITRSVKELSAIEKKMGYEPSIIKIQRNKRTAKKKEQATAKAIRVATKKANSKKKPAKKKQ